VKTALIYSQDIRKYDFGKGHPFRGDRFDNFMALFEERFAADKDSWERVEPSPATHRQLCLVHDEAYIKIMAKDPRVFALADFLQYATFDNLNPSSLCLPEGLETAARTIAGASLLAGELIYDGKFQKAVAIGGGLHHASHRQGEGFCIYNDVAICARNLLEKGATRILILDTDAHAGNGTAQTFYGDSRVLFIDMHQDPATIYPGSGFTSQIGEAEGTGFTVNIPLPPGSGNDAYQYVFESVALPLTREFKPQVIIRNGGSDPYYRDGLTDLGLTLSGFRMIGEYVRDMADEACQGKSADLLASGYNQDALPHAWAALLCGLLDLDIDLSDLKEDNPPPENAGYDDTKKVVANLKHHLKPYWRCMEE